MLERVARASAKPSAICSAVEHVFNGQKHSMALIVRHIGIARARIMIGMANLAYTYSASPGLTAILRLQKPKSSVRGEIRSGNQRTSDPNKELDTCSWTFTSS